MPDKKKFKKIISPLLTLMVSNKITWKIISFYLRMGEWMRYQRSIYENKLTEERLKIYFKDRIVRNGFFKGMKYVSFQAIGSSLFPKLLGSYEIELYPTFLKYQQKHYANILDIGCAEGYYAVGLALRFPHSKIFGYDIDKKALELCADLAKQNAVQDRVFLSQECTASTLETFTYSDRTLIICDCEGYERQLFNTSNICKLKEADLIIELHSFVERDIKEYLVDLFSNTHKLSIISSHDNDRKMFDFEFSLQDLTPSQRLKAIEEGRPFTMDWLIAEAYEI